MPKRFDISGSAELVTYVLLPSGSPELVGLYHNRSPQPIRGISTEFLFARFAWSLFTDEHVPFFQSSLEYAVRLWDNTKGEAETQTVRGVDVRAITRVFEPTASRSGSPKKRSLLNQDGAQDDDYNGYWSDGFGGQPDFDSWDEHNYDSWDEHDYDSWDEPPRGR